MKKWNRAQTKRIEHTESSEPKPKSEGAFFFRGNRTLLCEPSTNSHRESSATIITSKLRKRELRAREMKDWIAIWEKEFTAREIRQRERFESERDLSSERGVQRGERDESWEKDKRKRNKTAVFFIYTELKTDRRSGRLWRWVRWNDVVSLRRVF